MRPAGDPAEEWFGNETFFLRRGDRVSTVTSGFAAVNFDPDVFADALVFCRCPCLRCRVRLSPTASFAMIVVAPHRVAMPVPFIAPCGDGYRFAKHHGKPAIQKCGKSANGRAF
jgi:hypothetical protein